jgi:hypothetical protein
MSGTTPPPPPSSSFAVGPTVHNMSCPRRKHNK